MKKIIEGWLDLDLKNYGDSSICNTEEEIGSKFYLELKESLIGQLVEFDEKKVRITIEELP